jgi:kinesin family member 6/9
MGSKHHGCPLAGSERLKKTMDSEDPTRKYDETIKKESMHINTSLSYLEQCVVSLLRKGNAYVPYRQCKLTNLLKDSIGGNCSTLMIACIWGEKSQIEETISTLR